MSNLGDGFAFTPNSSLAIVAILALAACGGSALPGGSAFKCAPTFATETTRLVLAKQ